MARKKRNGTCGLCGARSEVSREHFVPRGLWAGPLPNRIETIPACEQCNAGTNLDDEYFRNTLVMMFDLTHPGKRQLFAGPVLRSFRKHPGWIKHALSKVRMHPLLSPSGLWLGNYPVLPLDVERFNRSLSKILRALFFLLRKRPFPASGQIGLVGQFNSETRPLINMIEENLFPPTFDFGDDIFEWRFSQTGDGITMWKLIFYRSVAFYACGFENGADLAEAAVLAQPSAADVTMSVKGRRP